MYDAMVVFGLNSNSSVYALAGFGLNSSHSSVYTLAVFGLNSCVQCIRFLVLD